jgi:hypothetical protein
MFIVFRPDFEVVNEGGFYTKSNTYHENEMSGFCLLPGSCWVLGDFYDYLFILEAMMHLL